jgi:glyoxylate reductase
MEKIKKVDALVTMLSDEVDKEIFEAATRLKIIAQMAVGFNNIDLAEATNRGICITNTSEVLTETTADYAFALLMTVARRVVEADRFVRDHKWDVAWHPNMFVGRDIFGATIGIIGAGRIGQAVASRARGFNMKILYVNHSPMPEMEKTLGAKRVNLEELLRESDFVMIHLPLTKETNQFINADNLRLMKKTSFLVNNSRGSVVD